MFYNYCRSTKATTFEKKKQNAKKKLMSISHSPSQRILNLHKRQKLKNLLMLKFIEKYNINYPDQTIEQEVTKFVQGEKLTDKDLQRLNNKIHRLALNNSAKKILEKTLNKKSTNPFDIKDNNNNNNETYITNDKLLSPPKDINKKNTMTDLNNLNNNLYPRNDVISLPKVNEYKDKENKPEKKLKHSQSSINISNNTYSLFPKNSYYRNSFFKSPEEELAELEKELEIQGYHNKDKKEKRIDFSKEGNEWNAISKYKQKLYQQQLIEEKMKENEIKKRTKEDLDNQIKYKMQKEYEEIIKEKEFDELINQKMKKMDEVDKIKAEKMKEQIKREKESRDKLLKEMYTRRKIEYLKEKKLDNEIVNNVKKKLEKELTDRYMKKKQANEAMKKAIKEIELKKIKLKEIIQRQKEDEKIYLKEQQKTEDQHDKERQKLFDKINFNANKFIIKNAEEIVEKNKTEQKKENEKIEYYIEEKRKAMEQKEIKEKMRIKEQKKELKKFLDMQVEAKKKEQIFLKKLDYERARIWNIDYQRYNEDEKMIDNKLKNMNKKNLEYIIKQMKEQREKKLIKNNSDMTNDEYDMNKELLQKAKNSFMNEEKNK